MRDATPLDSLPAGVHPADIFLPPTQPVDITALIRAQRPDAPMDTNGSRS